MTRGRTLITTIALLLIVWNSFAQSSHSLSGSVKDRNGEVVAGAQVTLRGVVSKSVATDSNGNFYFGQVPPGDYVLTVVSNGFAEQSRKIAVKAQLTEIDTILEIDSIKAAVTAEIGQELDKKEIPQAINIIGNRQLLERTNPILAQAAQEEAGVNLQRTSPTMGGIFVRGLVGTKVNVYVDGVRYTTSAQRGGVSTFFNLNDASGLDSIEVIRGSSSAQYGSDALGGTISLLSRSPVFGTNKAELHGEANVSFATGDRSAGGSTLFSYGTNKLGGFVNLAGRKVGTIRTAGGIDSHSAITRFLGLPSNILGDRLPDTDFQQYGGNARLNYAPDSDRQFVLSYSRNQQDDGKRYDQLLGGDGNLIADLRNLMLDFGYVRYVQQNFLGFDEASFTASYNSQREERVNQGGQGDPFGNITHQYERTTAIGGSFFLGKTLPYRHSIVIGGDLYSEGINSPAYTVNPRTGVVTNSRPRVPDESHYLLGGVFLQDSWQAIPDRLRISGAIRYNIAKYSSKAVNSPTVGGFRLWGDDSLRTSDLSGRIGAVLRVYKELRIAANYSRGFRAPSVTDLGTVGLTGDGFEADFASAAALGGTIGSTADASAVNTGIGVSQQRSELTNNYDLSIRYGIKRFETEATFFYIDFQDSITKQSLILPAGAVGQMLGDQPIIAQNANGTVFVGLSTSPVLIRANYTGANIYGIEYEAEAKLTRDLKFIGNFTYIHAADKVTGLPPNIEGGTPPPTGFVSFKYEPAGKPYWLEFFSTVAAKQDRLSTLDISDRRTGATRTRAQIQNFFRRGACVRGLTNNPDGICGSGDETILLATGENLLQVQNRVLGVGVNSAPMFTSLPSYGIANIRGGYKLGDHSQIFWAFENILDQRYRNPSWGIDGGGRNLRVAYRYRF